ncbi:hypothetical protein BDZ91DRAFT_261129 [Kalaharituber pfeilii]|nr:hypothetical protein BDZ91DRAFT_261129 [Kalaharituber pfeilii]
MTKKQQHLQPCITQKPPFSVQAPVEKKEGEGIPRRHPEAKDGPKSYLEEDCRTTYDIVMRGARKFGDKHCLGSRKLIKLHEKQTAIKKVVDGQEVEVPKMWTYFEMSEYTYISFKEYADLMHDVGSGLSYLGLSKGDRVQIFAATSAKWLAMAHGAGSQSMTVVTAYDTLGQEGLTHSLVATGSKAIFLDPHLLPQLMNPLEKATEVKFIIYNVEAPVKQEHIDKLKEKHPRLTILSFDDLVKSGQENKVDPVPPTPEDLMGIMYTSGSTGPPKGVPLLHKNVVAAVTGVTVVIGPYIGPGDFLLTYLPLAHILEFVFENSCIFWGGTMGYGNPKTLADRSMYNCKGDIAEFKPTIMVGVPAVFETVKKGIIDKVGQAPAFSQKLFWGALNAKRFLLKSGLPGVGILDNIVFKKVREATGGRLRIMMFGGGPIAKETQNFLSMVIAPMVCGYGLTETAAQGTLTDPMQWTTETAGTVVGSVEIKLVDYPEAGYFTSNNPEQGEIWIRGDSVAAGYYENEAETAAAFSDGWFMTGDIGEWAPNGHLKIIDRKKNLVKTQNGEYIALEKLESVYRSVTVVQNICVYADQTKVKPIAIIVPVESVLKKIAAENKIEGEYSDIIHLPKLRSLVLKSMHEVGRRAGLAGIELIEGVVLAGEEWTPENNLVTSAQKLNRRGILEKYRNEIDEVYASA